jgi:Tfp pilus assembly protein PilO
MTGRLRADRLWVVGGALAALAALAVGWFFLISPKHAEADALQEQVAEAEGRLTTIQRRLVNLREDNAEVQKYRANLAKDRAALPTAAATSDLLRALQSVAGVTGVSVDGVVVGAAAPVDSVPGVHSLQVTLTVVGGQSSLNNFLTAIQQQLPRAVLVDNVSSVPAAASKSLSQSASMTMVMKAFVGTPTATPAG